MRRNNVMATMMVLVLMVTLVTPVFAGGGREAPAAADGESLSLRAVSVAGAGTAGTFYVMAVGFADLFSSRLGANAVGEVTGGSVENARLLRDHQVELAVMQLGVTQNAREGVRQFTDDGEIEIFTVSPVYPEGVQIITLENSGIDSVQDLRGKRIAVGSPGSGILAFAELFLETFDITFDDIHPEYLSFSEATTAFRDGSIDAMIANTAAPAPFAVDLETTHRIKLVSMSDDEIDRFTSENPQFYRGFIPGTAYDSISADVDTVVGWVVLNARPDLSDDDVYLMTKTLMENRDALMDVHASAQWINLDSVEAIVPAGVPFHPGAARYYAEQGVTVPTR